MITLTCLLLPKSFCIDVMAAKGPVRPVPELYAASGTWCADYCRLQSAAAETNQSTASDSEAFGEDLMASVVKIVIFLLRPTIWRSFIKRDEYSQGTKVCLHNQRHHKSQEIIDARSWPSDPLAYTSVRGNPPALSGF